MSRLVLVIALLAVSAFSAAATNSEWTYINQIGTGSSNLRTNIYVDEVHNPAGCTDAGVYQVNEDEVNGERILTLALAAFAAGKEVRFMVADECSYSGLPKVISIRLR